MVLTANALMIGGGTGAAPSVIATGSAGQHLTSGGAAANPSWTTATFPSTTAAGTILASGTANTVTATATPTLGVQSTTAGTLTLANTNAGAFPTTLASSASSTAAWTLTFPVATPAANGAVLTATTGGVSSWVTSLPVANGGTACTAASITCFNNITGFTAAGTTGTTSTNLVFSTSPTLVTPVLGAATGTSLALGGATIGTNALAVTGTTALSSTLTSAAHTITSTSANSLTAGANGTTNPAFNVDASTASSATGLNIKSAVAAGGLAVSTLSSGANENLSIDAKGTGTITLGGTSTGGIILKDNTASGNILTFYANTAATPYSNIVFVNNNNTATWAQITSYPTFTNLNVNGSNFQWTSTYYQPGSDNSLTLGASSFRWSTVYGYTVDAKTAHTTQAASPSLSTCGTSPTVATGSSNNAGQFTTGSATGTACTITFANAYPNYAFCTVSPASATAGNLFYISASSKTSFTVTTTVSSQTYNYICIGN